MRKVVFHLDNLANWERLFANLKNILKELNNNNEEFIIKVVVHSSAINGYIDSDIVKTIKEFENNVTFVACKNSLMVYEIDKKDLYHKIEITNVGVYYLTVKQAEGFSYIKI